jgi:hypothetical protein
MRRSSPYWTLLCVVLAACRGGETSSLDTYNTSAATSTGTDSFEGPEESTDTDESGTDETGEPGPYEGLRYIVTAEDDVLLGVNLDAPHSVPDPDVLVEGDGAVALFGPTPRGGQILSQGGRLDQLTLLETAGYDFSPLAAPETAWLDKVWFGLDAATAIMTVSQLALGVTNQLLWVTYNAAGDVTSATDITPPIEANGAVLMPEISSDFRYAGVLVDVELDSNWQIYALNIDPQPGQAIYIDQLDLLGLPPTSVGDFVWLDIHPNRISYRKEGDPGVFRPLAVDLSQPVVDRINLAPTLDHIYSMIWSPDQTRLLVSTNGATGYRELYLIDVVGATGAQPPVRLTEPQKNARVNTQSPIDFARIGHGFDNFGRVWYEYTDTSLGEPGSVGLNLVVVVDGAVIDRVELIEPYPGFVVDEVVFDAKLQLLGFRGQSPDFGGTVNYVDLSLAQTLTVTIDQNFGHDTLVPFDDVEFAWDADGNRLVMVGVQDAMTAIHVAQIGDSLGTTTEITLPDVESAPGIVIDHEPRISPDGEQVMLWYEAQDGRTGLVHAPLDGSAEGQVVLGLQRQLLDDAWLQYVPE